MPMTPQLLSKFQRLAGQLSPENLYQDGERSHAEANRERTRLTKEWRELEKQAGRRVTEDEVYELSLPSHRRS